MSENHPVEGSRSFHKLNELQQRMKKMEEVVNHPSHYKQHPSGVECIQITEHMNFNLGNAMKYIWRQGLKNGVSELTDLHKARWYIDREITRLENEEMQSNHSRDGQTMQASEDVVQ